MKNEIKNGDTMIKRVIKDKVGIIYLDRPKVINALNLDMIRKIRQILEEWENDCKIRAVLFDSLCEKGFCSGGDLKEVYYDYLLNEACNNKDEFFKKEFELDKYLMTYKKPVISHWFGITMGGGIGLTIHSDIIITDETVNWAMPETRLGFVPDVAVGKNLSDLPQALGQYLGLCGESLGASDLVEYGLCDYKINSKDYNNIIDNLFRLSNEYEEDRLVGEFRKVLEKYSDKEEISKIKPVKPLIDKYFSYERLNKIIENLKNDIGNDFASKTYENLSRRFPLMLAVQFKKYFICKNLTPQQTIDLDIKILNYAVKIGSMEEGIRATLIDMDSKANWQVKNIEDVDYKEVDKILGI